MNYYEEWLGITSDDPIPDYFQLLGISRYIEDRETIKAAAKRQVARLRKYKKGEHAETCQEMREKIKEAFDVLSDRKLRAEYVAELNARQSEDASEDEMIVTVPVTVVKSDKAKRKRAQKAHSTDAKKSVLPKPDSEISVLLIGGLTGFTIAAIGLIILALVFQLF